MAASRSSVAALRDRNEPREAAEVAVEVDNSCNGILKEDEALSLGAAAAAAAAAAAVAALSASLLLAAASSFDTILLSDFETNLNIWVEIQ